MGKGHGRSKFYWVGLFLSLGAASGCQVLPDKGLSCPADQVIYQGFNRAPRMRGGAYPIAILGTPWLGQNLGTHGYYYRPSEKDGIVYTCRAGHVDIAHLRIGADWTAYLTATTYRHLMKHKSGFSYKLAVDRSREYVQFTYPPGWDSLPEPQRRRIAREIALAVAPYMTYTMTSWHEMLTWFGFKCIGLPTEFPSAFSWEDSFSNLLGTLIAVNALQDSQHSYNEAVQMRAGPGNGQARHPAGRCLQAGRRGRQRPLVYRRCHDARDHHEKEFRYRAGRRHGHTDPGPATSPRVPKPNRSPIPPPSSMSWPSTGSP